MLPLRWFLSNGAAPRKKACIMDGRSNSVKLKTPPIRRVLIQLIGAWLVVLASGHKLYGQSCAMCYTTVAGGGKSVIHALQGGIIVLLIPPVLLFSGLTIDYSGGNVRFAPNAFGAALVAEP